MLILELNKERHQVHLGRCGGQDTVVVDGRPVVVTPLRHAEFAAQLDDLRRRVWVVADGDTIHVQIDGRAFRCQRIDPALSSGASATAGEGAAVAPMPGVVASVLAAPGQAVRCGDALLVIESMKMLLTITAAIDGVVVELPLAAGQNFGRGALLALVENKEPSA
jgi:3-methylcrotonyl-CoA carboxylase alpha subunit